MVVDTLGLPIRLLVHSAGVQDCDGAVLLLDKVRKRFPWLECVFACQSALNVGSGAILLMIKMG